MASQTPGGEEVSWCIGVVVGALALGGGGALVLLELVLVFPLKRKG